MKNKIIALILTFTLIFSSAFMLASADSVKLGDVNGDDKISASDARLALRASAKLETLSEDQKLAADVNFDEKISASDARIILRASAKIEDLPEMPTEENSSAESTESTTDPTTEPTEPTTEPTTEPDKVIAETYPEAIDAFFSGKYYLEALIGEEGDTSVMKMAVSEKGYEFSASLPILEGKDPIDLSIMQLAKTMHIKYPDVNGKRKVFILNEETMQSIKDTLGFDLNEVLDSEDFNDISFSFSTKTEKPYYSKGEYKGEECDVYTFDIEEGQLAFYAIGEDVKCINMIDPDGSEGTLFDVIQLTKRIPGKMLSKQGCTEVTLLEFIADLMAFVPQEEA